MIREDIFKSLIEKKAIHLSGPHPVSIHWLEKIDKEKLSEGVLSGEYLQVLGNEYSLVKINEKIKTRFFKFKINDVKVETIAKYASKNNYNINEALYIHFLEETKKIRAYKKWMGDVDGYDIKFIQSHDMGFMSQKTFIEYLEEVRELDVSNLSNKICLFLSGYDGGNDIFSKKNSDGITMIASEQDIMINQIVRNVTMNPEIYKQIVDDINNN